MNRSILAACGTALAMLAGPAGAQTPSGAYLQLNIGSGIAGATELSITAPGVAVGSTDADLDPGFFGSAAAGFDLGNNVALEGEVLYLKNDIDTDDLDRAVGTPLNASVQTQAIMANAYYSLGPAGSMTARIGAGVGYGQAEYELLGESDKADGVMWQVLLGAAYPLTDTVAVDVGYRYLRAPDYDFSEGPDTVSAETGAHVVSVGARFTF